MDNKDENILELAINYLKEIKDILQNKELNSTRKEIIIAKLENTVSIIKQKL